MPADADADAMGIMTLRGSANGGAFLIIILNI